MLETVLIHHNNNNFINNNEIHKTYTLPTFGKSYSGQVVWRHYIRELIRYKTFYKENKRDFQHQRKEVTRMIQINKYVIKIIKVTIHWNNFTFEHSHIWI